MISKLNQTNFNGLVGFYKKNNRKYAFNIKNNDTALEAVKGENGKYTLGFYKRFALENEKLKLINDVQDVEINEVNGFSGIMLDSDETFKINQIVGDDTFLELRKNTKAFVDKMEEGIIFIQNFTKDTVERVNIKSAKRIIVHNVDNDTQLYVDAKDLVLSNSFVDGRISLKAKQMDVFFKKNFDMLM